MATNRKASITKRNRETDQKDRVKDREARREERRARILERATTGVRGPQIAAPAPKEDAYDRFVDPDDHGMPAESIASELAWIPGANTR